MIPMESRQIEGLPSRRGFVGAMGGGLLALGGCGGGSGSASEPVVVPPLVVAPQITVQPKSVSGEIGQSVTLQVGAIGSNLKYQWQRGAVDIPGASAPSLAFIAQGGDHETKFSVRVFNEVSSVSSEQLVLTLILRIPEGISLLAGQINASGNQVQAAKDGVGENARFASMGGACSDSQGNLYVIDKTNKTLRKVTPFGVVTTLFQNFPSGGRRFPSTDRYGKDYRFTSREVTYLSDSALAIDKAGNFYGVRDRTIVKVAPDGTQSIFAGVPGTVGFNDGPGGQATFAMPTALAFDPQGNLLVADAVDIELVGVSINVEFYDLSYGGTIRKITPDGVVSTIFGMPGRKFLNMQFVRGGLYDVNAQGLVDPLKGLLRPSAIACDARGGIYVADAFFYSAGYLRRIDGTGNVKVFEPLPRSSIFYRELALVDDDIYLRGYGGFENNLQSVLIKVSGNNSPAVIAGGLTAGFTGFKFGPLPGGMGSVPGAEIDVAGLTPGPSNSLYYCSDGAVMRVRLP